MYRKRNGARDNVGPPGEIRGGFSFGLLAGPTVRAPRLLVLEHVGGGQGRERGTNLGAECQCRLWNEVGHLPVGSRAFWMQSSDRDALNFAATGSHAGKPQTFRREPIPALGRRPLRFFVLLHRTPVFPTDCPLKDGASPFHR